MALLGEDESSKNTKIDHKILLMFKTTVDSPNPEFPGTTNKKLLTDYAIMVAIIEPFDKICAMKNKALQDKELESFGKKIMDKVHELDKKGLLFERSMIKK